MERRFRHRLRRRPVQFPGSTAPNHPRLVRHPGGIHPHPYRHPPLLTPPPRRHRITRPHHFRQFRPRIPRPRPANHTPPSIHSHRGGPCLRRQLRPPTRKALRRKRPCRHRLQHRELLHRNPRRFGNDITRDTRPLLGRRLRAFRRHRNSLRHQRPRRPDFQFGNHLDRPLPRFRCPKAWQGAHQHQGQTVRPRRQNKRHQEMSGPLHLRTSSSHRRTRRDQGSHIQRLLHTPHRAGFQPCRIRSRSCGVHTPR